MSLIQAIFLGLLQGLTEFLPVSSSGHLVLFSSLIGVNEPSIVFEILLHFGTLVAVFIFFWQDIIKLIKSGINLIMHIGNTRAIIRTDPYASVVVMIIIGSIPTVIVALLFKDIVSELFNAPAFTGYMLIVTGTILFISSKVRPGKKQLEKLGIIDGLVVGVGQALAVLPGISRSGTTIAAGLLRKIKREDAARFSFLLSIPAILGSQVFAIEELFVTKTVEASLGVMLIGTVVAAVVGYVAIKLLLSFVRCGRLGYFSYYTWFVGLLVVLLSRI